VWASDWLDADRAADAALSTWLAAAEACDEPFEGLPFAVLGTMLPDGALLWAGNSMPVRDLDDWLAGSERAIRPLSNRGANGIDGVVSTALGAAAAEVGPVVLVVGDVSFLHDLNALVSARLHGLSATIVLVDNDGGGIFSFLAQATTDAPEVGLPEHYEELFGTPHGIDVGPIVSALGGEYREVGPASIRAALAASIGRPGVRVLAFRTDRARNVELHREAAAAVTAALARL
jgi:2-succinyl-5-enolpyruvyl-6-hydroxy-3-cyclohexene-1-carboxylate synthase